MTAIQPEDTFNDDDYVPTPEEDAFFARRHASLEEMLEDWFAIHGVTVKITPTDGQPLRFRHRDATG